MLQRSDKAVGRFINCWRRLLGAHSELYKPTGLEVASFGLRLNTGTSQSSGRADDSVLYVHNNDSLLVSTATKATGGVVRTLSMCGLVIVNPLENGGCLMLV